MNVLVLGELVVLPDGRSLGARGPCNAQGAGPESVNAVPAPTSFDIPEAARRLDALARTPMIALEE